MKRLLLATLAAIGIAASANAITYTVKASGDLNLVASGSPPPGWEWVDTFTSFHLLAYVDDPSPSVHINNVFNLTPRWLEVRLSNSELGKHFFAIGGALPGLESAEIIPVFDATGGGWVMVFPNAGGYWPGMFLSKEGFELDWDVDWDKRTSYEAGSNFSVTVPDTGSTAALASLGLFTLIGASRLLRRRSGRA